MRLRRAISAFCVCVVLIAGCSRTKEAAPISASSDFSSAIVDVSPADRDAIVAAIQKHLSQASGVNMGAMEMSVQAISINGDKAQADAQFRVKQGPGSMQITYTLGRQGSEWIVLSNQPGGGQLRHPPMDKGPSGTEGSPSSPSSSDMTDFLKNHPAPAKTSP